MTNGQVPGAMAVELITESSWIVGQLAGDIIGSAANLRSLLHLGEYELGGRGLLESGRLVDILNRDAPFLLLTEASIQPHFPMPLLERTVERVAVSRHEILCATPLQPAADAPATSGGEPRSTAWVERERRWVELQAGPILVRGELHVTPGSDPVGFFFSRDQAFIPLTNATAVYLPDPERQSQRAVLVVNSRRTQLLIPDPEPASGGASATRTGATSPV